MASQSDCTCGASQPDSEKCSFGSAPPLFPPIFLSCHLLSLFLLSVSLFFSPTLHPSWLGPWGRSPCHRFFLGGVPLLFSFCPPSSLFWGLCPWGGGFFHVTRPASAGGFLVPTLETDWSWQASSHRLGRAEPTKASRFSSLNSLDCKKRQVHI